ncbi:transcription elongation factor [Mesorhizobium sp. M2C.T.Ca.TU.002.02.1.1]|uniref:transcription elongation factor n=1 Tax=Mesorhizobium sp. M2C.T.Ca.TU.002.02.1.1 TaxID=2496788 RepID=UPI000FC9EABC|nr:transcription elongation factor [Mesorhizobium sp. M2C.T.Ca.TU.002.02.1.1]RUU58865.1 transcription elongation factor [Mesorhizobium sp. M2C.T.Ca.TU.002.02.1.1]RUU71766.1 transcription elongation factor [Mesorhizobium sp. M2C.T.Ca.TU.009.01.2.1]
MMTRLSLPLRRISASDRMRLQALARSLTEQSHPLAAALSEELDRAELRDPDDIREGTVSLDGFVTYRIMGSEDSERRLLIHPEDQMWPPAEISMATPLGITLLGLSAGDRTPIIGTCLRNPPWIEVIAVGPAATGGLARRPTFSRGAPS